MLGPLATGIVPNSLSEKIPLFSNDLTNTLTNSSIIIVENSSVEVTAHVSSNLSIVLNSTAEILNTTANNTLSTLSTLSSNGFLGLEISGTSLALIGAAIAVGAAGIASAIGAGITGATGARALSEDPKNFSTALLFQALPQTQGIYGFLISILILLGAGVIGIVKDISLAQGLGALGAGLAVGLAAVSAIGQGIASSSAIGSVSEDKKLFGKSILFSVLPETQALYGFIIAILILIGMGLFGGPIKTIPLVAGWAAIGAGLAVGIAGISALGQGMAASTGIGAVMEKSKSFGKSILFSVLPETQALYGFIIAILILIGFGILGVPSGELPLALGFFAIAAGLSVGIAALSAIGQGIAASAGITSVAEDDKMFGKSILFSVLPETQALYGFLIAVLILVGGGIIGAVKLGITTPIGVVAIGASLAVGFAALSAIGQGVSAASGIAAVTEKKEMFGKSIIFSIIPETQALMGFLIAILLLIGAGIMGSLNLGITLPMAMVAIGAGLAVGLAAVSAVGQGSVVSSSISAVTKDSKIFGKSLLFSVLPQTQALYGFLIAILLLVGAGLIGVAKTGLTSSVGLMGIGAGLAVGLSAISAIGQGLAASSAVSSVSSDSKTFGKGILFSVLPETQALYGFLIAILIMVGGGLVGAVKTDIPFAVGLASLGAGLAVGLAAVSAIGQGIVASSGIDSVLRKPKVFGKAILFSVLPETQALYGFLIAILILVGTGIMGAVKIGITSPIGVVALGAGLAVGIAAVSAIGQGVSAASGITSVTEKKEMFGKSIIFSIIPETQALMGFLIAILLLIGAGIMGTLNVGLTMAMAIVSIGAGLAVGLAAVSAVGQGSVVSTGIAAVTKNSKMFGKSLLFSVLPQTQALYGFLISILLMAGGGLFGVVRPELTVSVGLVAIGAGLAVGIAGISAIGQGIVASSGITSLSENNKMFGKGILFSVLPETQALYGFLVSVLLLIGGGLLGQFNPGLTVPLGFVAIGTGLAVGLAAFSAIGQGISASSGIGSVTENEKLFGKSILYSVLPETQALYGTIIAILMMTGVGLMGVLNENITLVQGLGGIGIGLAIGLSAISAIGQGIVSASGIGSVLRSNKNMGKSIVLSVIPETYAIFGLLISILIMLGIGIL
jgi:V/A-type H+/Na+-transporting ATPase subunit K